MWRFYGWNQQRLKGTEGRGWYTPKVIRSQAFTSKKLFHCSLILNILPNDIYWIVIQKWKNFPVHELGRKTDHVKRRAFVAFQVAPSYLSFKRYATTILPLYHNNSPQARIRVLFLQHVSNTGSSSFSDAESEQEEPPCVWWVAGTCNISRMRSNLK